MKQWIKNSYKGAMPTCGACASECARKGEKPKTFRLLPQQQNADALLYCDGCGFTVVLFSSWDRAPKRLIQAADFRDEEEGKAILVFFNPSIKRVTKPGRDDLAFYQVLES